MVGPDLSIKHSILLFLFGKKIKLVPEPQNVSYVSIHTRF